MPRRNALIVAGVGLAALLVAIVLLWSKGEAGSTQAFCDTLRKGENPLDVFDRYDPSNATAAKAQLQQGADRLRQLQHAAPSAIAGDMNVLVGVATQLVTALDPTASTTSVPDFSGQADKIAAASTNVTRFASANCGVELESGATSVTTSAPTPGT